MQPLQSSLYQVAWEAQEAFLARAERVGAEVAEAEVPWEVDYEAVGVVGWAAVAGVDAWDRVRRPMTPRQWETRVQQQKDSSTQSNATKTLFLSSCTGYALPHTRLLL